MVQWLVKQDLTPEGCIAPRVCAPEKGQPMKWALAWKTEWS